ncbi:alpha-N-acetylgalactosamine-specific lectin-like [Strongylocentrotus purpuratus]|uniref:C-type lectin domain-containing protein n=1 Tax=Strongylocentrotus purpuratus TaxID=7668 RepID=A0A7M7PBX1_STRPU|nr:alpha-N-acetylgalactosamine-specific lectin-like [Strongylocentrotus purpuratus]XP_030848932.1 alpha-N-acetylgalactosamine-specific lectin-like [Strongylocentrotus purpuratus]|eukprot:XP_003728594.1 PREDICTED: alpha-N-acetylgalactosamine-specific lectin-like [Strongylocentrotus purpuratus]
MNINVTISLFLLAAVAGLSNGCCPERFMQVGDWCYYYNSDKVDWHDADDACTLLGANLVSIHSSDESAEIYTLWKSLVDEGRADDSDKAYWIGLHDQQNEGTFIWSDGTTKNYEKWQDDEPNDHKGEDCVALHNEGSNDYDRQEWNDCDCGDKKPYFCRRSATN